ncbi:MAG: hypothetical protein ACOCPM_03260 [Bacteroidales bacterium]
MPEPKSLPVSDGIDLRGLSACPAFHNIHDFSVSPATGAALAMMSNYRIFALTDTQCQLNIAHDRHGGVSESRAYYIFSYETNPDETGRVPPHK